MNKKLFVALVALLLVAVFMGATYVYRAEKAQQAVSLAARNRDALVRAHAPTLGPAQAPVHIVEFLDPACETCAAFWPLVKQLMARHPRDVRLSIRYAPLHQGSLDVIRLLEASRLQGRYWETLETLLRTQNAWTEHHTARIERVWPQLGGVGLDVARLKADMASPAIERLIEQDVRDLRALNVSKTPEYFVNGRPLPEFGFDPLVALVQQELQAAGRAR